jgi:hypothetical protein
MPGDVDYVQVPIGVEINSGGQLPIGPPSSNDSYGGVVRLPTSSTVTVNLQPVYSRKNIAENFTLDKYARGLTIQGGNSTKGGFI